MGQIYTIFTESYLTNKKRYQNVVSFKTFLNEFLNFMKTEGILKDHRDKKSRNKTKTRIYKPDEEISVQTTEAGMFLKEVTVGNQLEKGQKIGEVRDLYSGKRLEELTSPEDGFLITLRQYPIVYEKEPIAIILSAKDSWQKMGFALKSIVKG